jgi:type I restriction enzyme S subunit
MTVCGKYIHTTKESITDKGIKNSSARVFPQNTVLLAMYGSVGKVAIAKSPMATSQAILGIQPNSAICGYEFLYYALCAMNNVFLTLGQGGVQSNLNKGLIEDQYMPLPSLEEQDKIVKALSAMDDKIAAVNKELTLMETFKKGLLQQMFV